VLRGDRQAQYNDLVLPVTIDEGHSSASRAIDLERSA
jgi:hypothetical protein